MIVAPTTIKNKVFINFPVGGKIKFPFGKIKLP